MNDADRGMRLAVEIAFERPGPCAGTGGRDGFYSFAPSAQPRYAAAVIVA